MRVVKEELVPGFWYIGFSEEKLRVFRSAAYTDLGMMYNTYLLDAGEKFLALGTPPVKYTAEWLEAIEEIAGIRKIGWAVVFGEESDRTAVKELLKRNPEITIIAGSMPMYEMEGFIGEAFRRIELKANRTLQLGNRKLSFTILQEKWKTPSVYVVEEQQKILICADAFGVLAASDTARRSRMKNGDDYRRGALQYYQDIYGRKRKKSLSEAILLAERKEVRMICPGYGPVADEGAAELTALYRELFADEEQDRPEKTLAVFCENGGYVREMADQITAGVTESGQITVRRYQMDEMSRDEILFSMMQADAFLFGVCESRGDVGKPLWDLATSIAAEDCKGKIAAVFGNGSADGAYTKSFKARLEFLQFDLSTADFQIQGKPDAQQLKNAYEYGFDLSCILQRIPNPRRPKLVKCLVCGEIFDASLGICPVCGVGLDQCVPADEEQSAFSRDTDNRYVIVGGGAAAVSAAEAIRLRDKTGRITILSAEEYLPINRPMLTKDFEMVMQRPEELLIHDAEWYEEQEIEIFPGCRVVSIQPEEKTVHTDGGETIPYDRLIYAAGAECFVPPFKGAEKEEVLTIRHLGDSRKLAGLMKKGAHAVVIGGGVLGLEAANELMRSGVHVTVLEATPQIIGRQADSESAEYLKGLMKRMQVPCYENVTVEEIEGQEHVTGVRISDQTVFPADFVVISCGNRGNTSVAAQAGIEVDRAIVVNQRMETNIPDIYACGDCAQFDHVNYQLWQEAKKQGMTAGANAAGEQVRYAGELLGLSMEGFGTTLFAIGDPGKQKGIPYRKVVVDDQVDKSQEKYWFCGGALQGAVLIGHPEKTAEITRQVSVHARHSEVFS